jgi:hypothetical protein
MIKNMKRLVKYFLCWFFLIITALLCYSICAIMLTLPDMFFNVLGIVFSASGIFSVVIGLYLLIKFNPWS